MENKIITTAQAQETKRNIIESLRKEVIGCDFNEAYEKVVEYISMTEGALTELFRIKDKKDNILLTKEVSINIADCINDAINKKIKALERVAYNINLEDVLPDLESISWCCRLD